ncbi:hypothetical protein ABK040_008784 [Willaertia magna]
MNKSWLVGILLTILFVCVVLSSQSVEAKGIRGVAKRVGRAVHKLIHRHHHHAAPKVVRRKVARVVRALKRRGVPKSIIRKVARKIAKKHRKRRGLKKARKVKRAARRAAKKARRAARKAKKAEKKAKKALRKAKKALKKAKKAVEAPKPTPTTVLQQCQATGDPHYISFTGKRYDYYGIGDYVLAHSSDGNFVAHSRTGKWNKVSVNVGIAVKVDKKAIVEYNVNDDKFYKNKKEFSIAVGQKIELSKKGGYIQRTKTNGVIIASGNGAKLTAEWDRNPAAYLTSQGSAGHISLFVDSPKTVTWDAGLCLSLDATKQQAIGLMHDHKPRKIVKRTLPKPTAEQKQKAKEICIKAGIPERKKRLLKSCIIDVVLSGKTDGKDIAKVVAQLRKDEKKKRQKWAKKWAKKAVKKWKKKKAAAKKALKKLKKAVKKAKKVEKKAKKAEKKAIKKAKKAKKAQKKAAKKVKKARKVRKNRKNRKARKNRKGRKARKTLRARDLSKLKKEVNRLLKLKKKLGKKWNPKKNISKLVKKVLKRFRIKVRKCSRRVKVSKRLIQKLRRLVKCKSSKRSKKARRV